MFKKRKCVKKTRQARDCKQLRLCRFDAVVNRGYRSNVKRLHNSFRELLERCLQFNALEYVLLPTAYSLLGHNQYVAHEVWSKNIEANTLHDMYTRATNRLHYIPFCGMYEKWHTNSGSVFFIHYKAGIWSRQFCRSMRPFTRERWV